MTLYALPQADDLVDAGDLILWSDSFVRREPVHDECDRSPNGRHSWLGFDDEYGDPDDIGTGLSECSWCGLVVQYVPVRQADPPITWFGDWSWQRMYVAARPWIVRHRGRYVW